VTDPEANPQAASERREVARHLLQHPLTCAEQDPELFRLVRRHETTLDRWFTQRLGYRLHVDADTARLYKTTYVPAGRPLRTRSDRALNRLEYTTLALVLAATASGPSVISLRDLVSAVRSASADADITLPDDTTGRRALVAALKWMLDRGLAAELHDHVDRYADDADADAVLRLRPDRMALLPLPAVVGAATPDELLERAERRSATRPWLRCRLANDPVVYRDDLTDEEWTELRRRLGQEATLLHEMFGLLLEARSEGVAAIDPGGRLSDIRFPTSGTVSHAALLLVDRLRRHAGGGTDTGGAPGIHTDQEVAALMAELAVPNRRRWSGELVEDPARLGARAVELLCELRLAERRDAPGGWTVRLLPAAARFTLDEPAQSALW
jgi:uncharacterized protein (TIGR02678 family)